MEGKAWEIWSCVVTSGRQRVGSARWRISTTLSWNAHPRAGGLNIHKAADQYHLWFSMLGMGRCRTGIIMVGNHPLSFHLTSLDLPGLPHTANDQRLRTEMAWGRKLGWLCADRHLDKNILSVGSTTSTYSLPKPLIVSILAIPACTVIYDCHCTSGYPHWDGAEVLQYLHPLGS